MQTTRISKMTSIQEIDEFLELSFADWSFEDRTNSEFSALAPWINQALSRRAELEALA